MAAGLFPTLFLLPLIGCGYSNETTLDIGSASDAFSPDERYVYFAVRVHYYREPTGLLNALNFGGNVKEVYEGVDFFGLDTRASTLEAVASYAIDSLKQKQGGVASLPGAYGIEAYRVGRKDRRGVAALYAFVDVSDAKQALQRRYFKIDLSSGRLQELTERRYESRLRQPSVRGIEQAQRWPHVWVSYSEDGSSVEALRFEDGREENERNAPAQEDRGRVIGEGTRWLPHSF